MGFSKILLNCVTLGICATGVGQISGAKASELIDSWLAHQTNVQTWSADFRQTRTLKSLVQPLVSTGQVWFAAPKNFRWELGGRPPQTIAIRNGEMLQVAYPRLNRAEKYDLSSMRDKQWKDALGLLQSGFPRSRAEFDSEFKLLSVTATNATHLLDLEPRSVAARKLMPKLRIGLATNDCAMSSTELFFADGSSMRNDFFNAVPGAVLSNQFDLSLPTGYTLVEPAQPKR